MSNNSTVARGSDQFSLHRCGRLAQYRPHYMSLFDLVGEVSVVIGATGGLGGVLAEGLAFAGAKVAVLGRNTQRGETRARAIEERGGYAQFFSADALDKTSLHLAHEQIVARLGAPTILVNAAGGNDPKVTVTAE